MSKCRNPGDSSCALCMGAPMNSESLAACEVQDDVCNGGDAGTVAPFHVGACHPWNKARRRPLGMMRIGVPNMLPSTFFATRVAKFPDYER